MKKYIAPEIEIDEVITEDIITDSPITKIAGIGKVGSSESGDGLNVNADVNDMF